MEVYKKITLLGLFAYSVWSIYFIFQYEIPYETKKFEVLGKMEQMVGRGSSNYILILKDDKGIISDLTVTPSTYYLAEKSQIKYFKIQGDISTLALVNMVLLFSTIVMLIILGVLWF